MNLCYTALGKNNGAGPGRLVQLISFFCAPDHRSGIEMPEIAIDIAMNEPQINNGFQRSYPSSIWFFQFFEFQTLYSNRLCASSSPKESYLSSRIPFQINFMLSYTCAMNSVLWTTTDCRSCIGIFQRCVNWHIANKRAQGCDSIG